MIRLGMRLVKGGAMVGEWKMNAYFQELGCTILTQWQGENFSLVKFPGIAQEALEARPPCEQVDLPAFLCDFLRNDDQASQTESGFGQPELVAYDHPRFYIQVLFWLDGTTDIHQHEFSGAFHVMAGSSIHANFSFENVEVVNPHFRTGEVRMTGIELLETGRTVQVHSGPGDIHSLFHLETPSITVVVRTQNDPGTGPQLNYLPPHLAFDPAFADALMMRRKQLLDVLEVTEDPTYPQLVREMLADLDLERGFFLLQHGRGHLLNLCCWEETLAVFEQKHGALAAGVAVTLEECARRDIIKELRCTVAEPEHRFFLALLLNGPDRDDLLALVAQRFPEAPAIETILRWAEELGETTDFGTAILDAYFPESVEVADEDQPDLLLGTLRHFLEGGDNVPKALSSLSAEEIGLFRAAFIDSSLRVLIA
jgi:hypothetical protein